MKKSKVLLSAFFLVAAVCSLASGGERIEAIVAVVGNEVITLSELENFYREEALREQIPQPGREPDQGTRVRLRERALASHVERKLLLAQARRLEMKVSESQVEKEMDRIRKRFPEPEDFYRDLERAGLTENRLRKQVEEQLLVNELRQQYIVRGKITVDKGEIGRFYTEHSELYRVPEKVSISQILLRRGGEGARKRGEGILGKVRGGADFASLARGYSEGPMADKGGVLGFLARGEMLPEIERAVFELDPGQVSGLLESRHYFHIIKVNSRQEGRRRELGEEEEGIGQLLRERKAREVLAELLEVLRKRTYVWIEGAK